ELTGIGGEHLVLAEDPSGQVREDGAGLDTGEPGSDGGADRTRVLAAGEPLGERVDDLAQTGDVGGRPVLAVDDPDGRLGTGVELRVLSHVDGGVISEAAQVGDGVGRLFQAHLGPRLAQGARSGCGKIPIDKLHHALHVTRGQHGDPVDDLKDRGRLRVGQRQPQAARAARMRSRASCAGRVPPTGTLSASTATASSRPSAVNTNPATLLTERSVPVFTRTTPAAAPPAFAFLNRLTSVPLYAATGRPLRMTRRSARSG